MLKSRLTRAASPSKRDGCRANPEARTVFVERVALKLPVKRRRSCVAVL